jgi:hypothetical protein
MIPVDPQSNTTTGGCYDTDGDISHYFFHSACKNTKKACKSVAILED